MDINYFIFLKKTYEDALKNIEYNINENNTDNKFYKDRKKNFLELIDICNINIYTLCQHEFEEDWIDIDPDRSKKITYCKFCEFTKK
jgi:hypothetical protein